MRRGEKGQGGSAATCRRLNKSQDKLTGGTCLMTIGSFILEPVKSPGAVLELPGG